MVGVAFVDFLVAALNLEKSMTLVRYASTVRVGSLYKSNNEEKDFKKYRYERIHIHRAASS
jgi:hypothetical protein